MRYIVHAEALAEGARRREGTADPRPLFTHLVERFKPEVAYANPARRALWMVVDVADLAEMMELVQIIAGKLGTPPTLTPVLPVRFPENGPTH